MTIAGKWTITMNTPMGEQKGLVELVEENGVLTGSMTGSDGDTIPIKDGKLDGAKAIFKVPVRKPIPLSLTFTVTAEGDNLSGNFRPGMFPPQPVTGVRA